MRAILLLATRELRLGLAGWGLTIVFFLLVATLFPFAIGPGAAQLARLAPGVLWIAALLAALLPVERLIAPDREAGVLDQLVARGIAEETIALAKLIGHWLSFGPALRIAALPAAALFDLDGAKLGRIELGLLIGTPALAALSIAVAALTAASRGASAIAGLLPPTAGTVGANGAIGWLGEAAALDPKLTLRHALGFWARLDGRDDAVVTAALERMDIGALAEVPVRMLSTGQRRRAAIARVLASGADLWLLDEPGSGLDDAALTALGETVAAHRAQGGIVVAATHQPLAIEPAITVTLGR
jgi:heme exporter protein B